MVTDASSWGFPSCGRRTGGEIRFHANRMMRSRIGRRWVAIEGETPCMTAADHQVASQRRMGARRYRWLPMLRTKRRPAADGQQCPPSNPILASKITAPNVPDWAVQRPRITKLIAEGTRWCPLTVVTGPPGAGKTMALALWAAAEPGTVAWVCLDEFDNRPGVFWSYVVAALRRCGVAVPKTLRGVPQEAGDDGFLLRLTAALAAQDPPVTLVLDDLHLLTEPEVLKGLEFVLRNVGARPAPGGCLANGSAAAAAPVPAGRTADRNPGQRPRVQHR